MNLAPAVDQDVCLCVCACVFAAVIRPQLTRAVDISTVKYNRCSSRVLVDVVVVVVVVTGTSCGGVARMLSYGPSKTRKQAANY